MNARLPTITVQQNVHDLGAILLVPRCGYCMATLTVIGNMFGHAFHERECPQKTARFELITDNDSGALKFVEAK